MRLIGNIKLGIGFAILITYSIIAIFTLKFLTANGVISVIWLPSGVAFACLLLWGRKYWPFVFAAAFIANYYISSHLLISALIAVGNTLEAIIGLSLLTYIDAHKALHYQLKVLLMLCLILSISAMISALNGCLVLLFFEIITQQQFIRSLLHWWQGDFFGLVYVVPYLVVFQSSPKQQLKKLLSLPFMLFCLATLVISVVFFMLPSELVEPIKIYSYLLFLLIIFSAILFQLEGALIALALVILTGVIGIANGSGIYSYPSIDASLVDFWVFVTALSFNSYVISITLKNSAISQQALKKSEERFRLTLDKTNQGLYDLDVITGKAYVNEAYERMLGYQAGKLKETIKKWLKRLHPDDKERVTTYFQEYIAGLHPEYRIDFRMQKVSGDYIWVQSVCAIVDKDKTGRPIRMLGTHLDITPAKIIESELNSSTNRLKVLMNNLTVGIAELTLDGCVAYLNPYGLSCFMIEQKLVSVGKVTLKDILPSIKDPSQALQKFIYEGKNHHEFQKGKQVFSALFVPLLDSHNQIHAVVAYFYDITEQKKFEHKLWQMANYDSLTKLPNRHHLNHSLEQAFVNSLQHGLAFALLFIDLDKFKEINDGWGHKTGDELLCRVAQHLQKHADNNTLITRQGGDEFCILIQGEPSKNKIINISNQIIHTISQPFYIDQECLFVTTSIGIVLSEQATSTSDLLKMADLALYQAKAQGKNQYCFFDIAQQDAFNLKNMFSRELTQAVEKQQIMLVYQPIICLKTKKVLKAEVLIRWQHPRMGLLAPSSFIGFAEENGTIIDIGYHVLDKALLQLKKWQSKYQTSLQLSINRSPVEINNTKRHFINDVKSLLKKHQISAQF